MFQRSAELAAVLKRIVVAFESRDVATARSLLSQADETLVLGTDAMEWWYGVEGYELFAAHVEVTPEFRWTIHRLDAFEEGSVGWAAADTTVAYASGMTAHIAGYALPEIGLRLVFGEQVAGSSAAHRGACMAPRLSL